MISFYQFIMRRYYICSLLWREFFLLSNDWDFMLVSWKRDASACEESSCLRLLLDKRDAWLGPWIPGRCLAFHLIKFMLFSDIVVPYIHGLSSSTCHLTTSMVLHVLPFFWNLLFCFQFLVWKSEEMFIYS